jgi:ribulose-phosphate 3-epimerase
LNDILAPVTAQSDPSTSEPRTQVFASLLSGDFGRLAEQVDELECSGAVAGLHIDVMDGRFVPNFALGPQAVEALRQRTCLPIEVHLMVERPATALPIFAAVGAQRLILHAEATPQLHRDMATAARLGTEVGVALNPATSLHAVEHVIDELDELLLMGVDPGFGGQAFIEAVTPKIRAARRLIGERGGRAKISIDGGVKPENARRFAAAGADLLAVGSALFGPPGIAACAARLRAALMEA